jgi:hypothetical protein
MKKSIQRENFDIDIVPENNGILILKRGSHPLFHIRTNNLAKLAGYLFLEQSEDQHVIQSLKPVLNLYDKIELVVTKDEFTALCEEKRFLRDEKPEFTDKIRTTDDYVYLGLDFTKHPYTSIEEATTEDKFYIGPFTNRFFLLGLLSVANKYQHTPACADNNQIPCSLYGENTCPGYCLGNETGDLASLLKRNFVLPNNELLSKLAHKCDDLNDNLEFQRAHAYSVDIRVLNKYNDLLKFFSTIKYLDYSFRSDGMTYHVENGLLDRVSGESKTEVFSGVIKPFTDYRTNEKLAVPKDQYAEMWTTYKKVRDLAPEIIDEIFEKTILDSIIR